MPSLELGIVLIGCIAGISAQFYTVSVMSSGRCPSHQLITDRHHCRKTRVSPAVGNLPFNSFNSWDDLPIDGGVKENAVGKIPYGCYIKEGRPRRIWFNGIRTENAECTPTRRCLCMEKPTDCQLSTVVTADRCTCGNQQCSRGVYCVSTGSFKRCQRSATYVPIGGSTGGTTYPGGNTGATTYPGGNTGATRFPGGNPGGTRFPGGNPGGTVTPGGTAFPGAATTSLRPPEDKGDITPYIIAAAVGIPLLLTVIFLIYRSMRKKKDLGGGDGADAFADVDEAADEDGAADGDDAADGDGAADDDAADGDGDDAGDGDADPDAPVDGSNNSIGSVASGDSAAQRSTHKKWKRNNELAGGKSRNWGKPSTVRSFVKIEPSTVSSFVGNKPIPAPHLAGNKPFSVRSLAVGKRTPGISNAGPMRARNAGPIATGANKSVRNAGPIATGANKSVRNAGLIATGVNKSVRNAGPIATGVNKSAWDARPIATSGVSKSARNAGPSAISRVSKSAWNPRPIATSRVSKSARNARPTATRGVSKSARNAGPIAASRSRVTSRDGSLAPNLSARPRGDPPFRASNRVRSEVGYKKSTPGGSAQKSTRPWNQRKSVTSGGSWVGGTTKFAGASATRSTRSWVAK